MYGTSGPGYGRDRISTVGTRKKWADIQVGQHMYRWDMIQLGQDSTRHETSALRYQWAKHMYKWARIQVG